MVACACGMRISCNARGEREPMKKLRRKAPTMNRRDVVRLVPFAVLGSALVGLTRALTACSEEVNDPARERTTTPTPTPDVPKATDQDEFVPGPGTPVNATPDGVPTLPMQ